MKEISVNQLHKASANFSKTDMGSAMDMIDKDSIFNGGKEINEN